MVDSQWHFRFGMKALLLLITLACIILALVSTPIIEARRQQSLLAHVTAAGGRTSYLGEISRDMSPGTTILSAFSSSYDRHPLFALDFSGTNLKNSDLENIAGLTHVKELSLSGTEISDAGLRHLRNLKYLTKLDLSSTQVTDRGMQSLSSLSALASLDVRRTSVSYDALQKLDTELPYAHFCEERAIDELKAAGVQVVDPKRLVDGDSTRACMVVEAGREAIAVVVGMNRPASLTARDVINLGHLQSLRQMTIHSVTLGPVGLAPLPRLNALKDLSFWNVNLSDADLEALARQAQLESLTIRSCNGISERAVEALREQLPQCQIDWSIH